MTREFLRTLLTPTVRAAQKRYYGRTYPDHAAAPHPDTLGADERQFAQARDSFYLATISEDGWPYVQHRGGPIGFLTSPTARELAFADYGGNRQLISVGSIASTARVCLFLMDYPARTRLKILGVAEVMDAREHPDLVEATKPPTGHAGEVERIVRITVHSFDWNCPKFISPRFTSQEVDAVVGPLRTRIASSKGNCVVRSCERAGGRREAGRPPRPMASRWTPSSRWRPNGLSRIRGPTYM